ncbi:MAG TPA: fibronectin type III domain-containing protein [Myxococcaceae bacterium]|nr:fibronectin type III domain-containing protein [Myxococcaceae bacterium]
MTKFFDIEVHAPSTVVAGTDFSVTIVATCRAHLDGLSLEWIGPDGAALASPYVDGVVVPPLHLRGAASCSETTPLSVTVRLQTTDEARLGDRIFDLRATGSSSGVGGTDVDTVLTAVRVRIVAPTAPGFSLQVPAQVTVGADGGAMSVDVRINRSGEGGPVMLAGDRIDAPDVDPILAYGAGPGPVKLAFAPAQIVAPDDVSRLTVEVNPFEVVRDGQVVGVVVRATAGSTARAAAIRFLLITAPPPMPLLAARASVDSVDLSWNADPTVDSYLLEREDATGSFVPLGPRLGGTLTSYQDVGLAPATTYRYRLTARNLNGDSPPAMVTTTTLLVAPNVTLTVSVTGSGTVTSTPAGISCPGTCSHDFALTNPATDVTLTATPISDAGFLGWSGGCTGVAPSVVVHLTASKTCGALFTTVSSGWQTLVPDLATSLEADVRSSVVLDAEGQAFTAELLRVGTQDRLTVRQEGAGSFAPLGGALNANATWSATSADLLLDPGGAPILAFNADNADSYVARWDGSQWGIISPQPLRLGTSDTRRPRIVRSGNTLIAAWIEGARIAVRRYDLVTQQWDAGSFTPDPDGSSVIAGPRDLDLAVDSGGLALVAYSVGATAGVLRVARETSPGSWTALGGDVGIRPGTAPTVQEFGLHVDGSDVVRIAWVEGTVNYFVRLAQFDGVNWGPLPGRIETWFLQSSLPVRSLGVNRNRALFAFAYALDRTNPDPTQSDVVVQQWVGNTLVSVGTAFATQHPRVGSLSLAMNEANKATLLQSQYTTTGGVDRYTLLVRRHRP